MTFTCSALPELRDLPDRYTHMTVFMKILGIWFALNLAIPAFIIYQRSPRLRHRLFRLTVGLLAFPHERQLVHQLVEFRPSPPLRALQAKDRPKVALSWVRRR